MAKLACKQRTSNICLSTSKDVFDSVLADIQNAEHVEMLKHLVVVKLQQARTGCSNYVMSGKQCWSVSPDRKEQKYEFYPSVISLIYLVNYLTLWHSDLVSVVSSGSFFHGLGSCLTHLRNVFNHLILKTSKSLNFFSGNGFLIRLGIFQKRK